LTKNCKRVCLANTLEEIKIAANLKDEMIENKECQCLTRSTIEFIELWGQLHNPNFKRIEFDAFRNEPGLNSFTLAPKKWIETTND